MSSARVSLNWPATRSMTASELSRNSAEVPGVTFSRTSLMNESLIPTSAIEPISAPVAAPIARPRIGMKKIRPKSSPQNPPPSAPAFLESRSSRVFGLFLPTSQLTTAASSTWMSCWRCRSASSSSASWAPLVVSNFQTVSDDMAAPDKAHYPRAEPVPHIGVRIPHDRARRAPDASPAASERTSALSQAATSPGPDDVTPSARAHCEGRNRTCARSTRRDMMATMTTRKPARSREMPSQRGTPNGHGPAGDAAPSAPRQARRYQLDTAIKRLTPAERADKGRQLRTDVPRSSHAAFEPSDSRPDPIDLLASQSADRLPDLVPIRYGRMLASPFAYFRGAALPMAHDLSATPATGLAVQACGDAHLGNFGLFGSAERRLVFDINDFDETLPGPWEWDVKRLAASLEIAARENAIGKRARAAIVQGTVARYRFTMRTFAGQPNLDVFYATADVGEVQRRLRSRLTASQRARLAKGVARARTRDSMQALGKLTRVVDGRPQIVADPPIVVPLSSLLPADVDGSGVEKLLVAGVDGYKRTLLADRRYLLDQYSYEVADIARKVVGVGSVGTRCWIMLMLGRDESDPLFLQMKEAGPSVLSDFCGRSKFENQGQRVVEGQRLMQAASDAFLGWHRLNPAPDGVVRDFYIRQLRDWKLSLETQAMTPRGLSGYGEVCGWTLARAHARSGDRIAIAAYLGTSDTFDRAIAEFAASYADQNERDFAALGEAAASGRVLAQRGV